MSIKLSDRKCPRCGGGNWGNGELKETDRVSPIYLRLYKTPFFKLVPNRVGVAASMCLDCGLIELNGDIEHARKVLGR